MLSKKEPTVAVEEVRYHMLRPAQIVERRKACPVAYLPIGTLEWHGLHNPLGADTLQAEALAELCARKGGGVALPPLYYGEPRLDGLMEAVAADRDKIAEAMALPPENFTPARQPFTPTEQAMQYHALLIHLYGEMEQLGFEVGVMVAGHYPLVDHAAAAAFQFNRTRRMRGGNMLAWAFADYLLVRDRWPQSGDHGAGWETSHLLAICPQSVDLGELPAKGEKLVGIGGAIAPQDATAEFGRETMDAAAEAAVREVEHRLANKNLYFAHGMGMARDLWRQGQ
jgi:creatinine amidohydrolase